MCKLKAMHTSALYIFSNPLLTLVHVGTLLIPHKVLECSKNGPLLTYINIIIDYVWHSLNLKYQYVIS